MLLYHLYAVAIGYPSAERQARAGYVVLAEKAAAEARADEMERQRDAAARAGEEHRKRLQAAKAAEQAASADDTSLQALLVRETVEAARRAML
ncbi:hypothetical protein ACE04B_41845, partial [Rhizobium phaseoli]